LSKISFQPVNVFFILDSGAPDVTLTRDAQSAVYGENKLTRNMIVNGVPIPWVPSTAQFAHVNLLGQKFMKKAGLMVVPHWEANSFTLLPIQKQLYRQHQLNALLSQFISYKTTNIAADLTQLKSPKRVILFAINTLKTTDFSA
jgi:hypothetical protein